MLSIELEFNEKMYKSNRLIKLFKLEWNIQRHTHRKSKTTQTHTNKLPLSHSCCNILSQSLLQWDTTWHVYSTVCHSVAPHQGRGSDLSFLSPKASLYVTTQGDIMVATGGRSLFICTLHPCSQPQCWTEPALCVCVRNRETEIKCVYVCPYHYMSPIPTVARPDEHPLLHSKPFPVFQTSARLWEHRFFADEKSCGSTEVMTHIVVTLVVHKTSWFFTSKWIWMNAII